jgi:hypothetical protein
MPSPEACLPQSLAGCPVIDGEWLITITETEDTCERLTPPYAEGSLLTVVGNQVYSQDADEGCELYIIGELIDNQVVLDSQYIVTEEGCTYLGRIVLEWWYNDTSLAGSVTITRSYVSGSCGAPSPGLPCTETDHHSGVRCDGCSGCASHVSAD